MNTNETPVTGEEPTTCFVCGKGIGDGHWFARIKQGARRLIFCRPGCVEKFLKPPENTGAGGWPESGTPS